MWRSQGIMLHLISQLKLTASLRQGGHRYTVCIDISPQGEAYDVKAFPFEGKGDREAVDEVYYK